MITKLLTLVFSISISTAVALAQPAFSESKPYVPKENARRVEEKKVANPTAASQEVVIPVTVLDESGMPVTDLSNANFTVFVNDTEMPVTAFEKASALPKIILLLDMSPSAHRQIEGIRDQATQFVHALPAGANVLVAEFHAGMNIRAELTSERAEILRGISKTKVGDGTSLYGAVHKLFEKVLPPITGRRVVLLFTDGVDTTSRKSSYADSLHGLEKADVSVYPILYDTFEDVVRPGARTGALGGRFPFPIGVPLGRGRQVGTFESDYEAGRDYLNTLASASGGRVFASDKFDPALKSFIAQLSARYHLTVSVPQTGTTASRPLKVRINRPNLTVNARGSFIE